MSRVVSVLGWPDVRNVVVYIYGLTDPDGFVRYVGKSVNPKSRLTSHMTRYAAGPVANWATELKATGKRPGLVILQVVHPGEDADAAELRFIRQYRDQAKLLNARFAAERRDVEHENAPLVPDDRKRAA